MCVIRDLGYISLSPHGGRRNAPAPSDLDMSAEER